MFRADAVALLTLAACATACLRARRATALAWAGGLALAALLRAVLGGGEAPAWLVLAGGVSLAAGGIAALGAAVGLARTTSATFALLVLATAASALRIADPIAARVEFASRHPMREAVIAADPLLALAYGPSAYDRLHEPGIYASVPLAASTLRLPDAFALGGASALLGACCFALSRCLPRSRAGGRSRGAHR